MRESGFSRTLEHCTFIIIYLIFRKAILVLDTLSEIKKDTVDSLKVLCRIKLLEGKIFQDVLASDDSARLCFK